MKKIRETRFLTFFCLCLVSSWGEAIHLKDGTVLQGERIRSDDSVVVIRTPDLGEVRVPKTALADTSTPKPTAAPAPRQNEATENAARSMVLMPTAFTPPAGTWSFDDFELVFLTMSYSPTATTSLTVGALFPFDPADLEAYTLGFKQRLFQTPAKNFALALTGDISLLSGSNTSDFPGVWTANAVGSYAFSGPDSGSDFADLHVAAGGAGSWEQANGGTETHSAVSLAVGGDQRATANVDFLVEFLWGGEFLGTTQNESILNLGIRIHGQRLSAAICGFRVLSEDLGNLLLLPMIKIGYSF